MRKECERHPDTKGAEGHVEKPEEKDEEVTLSQRRVLLPSLEEESSATIKPLLCRGLHLKQTLPQGGNRATRVYLFSTICSRVKFTVLASAVWKWFYLIFLRNLWVRLGHRESFSAELLDCDYQSANVGHLHLYFLPSFKKRLE